MPAGGELRIEAMSGGAGARGAAGNDANLAVIRVTDTGVGMAPDVLARACEPFFSTKGLNGTGLGLSMVYGFARQSGGDLRMFSERTRGTSVELWLPLARSRHARRSRHLRAAVGFSVLICSVGGCLAAPPSAPQPPVSQSWHISPELLAQGAGAVAGLASIACSSHLSLPQRRVYQPCSAAVSWRRPWPGPAQSSQHSPTTTGPGCRWTILTSGTAADLSEAWPLASPRSACLVIRSTGDRRGWAGPATVPPFSVAA